MAEKRGYFRTGDLERDVLGCTHCTRQILLTPPKGCDRTRLNRCGQCSGTICDPCAKRLLAEARCRPWEARVERTERREEFLRKALA